MQVKGDGPYPPRCNPEPICDNGQGVKVLCYCCYGPQSKICWMTLDLCNERCNQPPIISSNP